MDERRPHLNERAKTEKGARLKRLEEEMRTNLLKRKAQRRAKAAPPAEPEPEPKRRL